MRPGIKTPARCGPAAAAAGLAAGCQGPQSALAPAGTGAEHILSLFGWLAAGAAVIWLLLMAVAVYAMRVRPGAHSERAARWFIVLGGVAFPTLALTAVLVYGLSLMPSLTAAGDGLVVEVAGEQWWWRVHYLPPAGPPVTSANEVRLPAGERIEFRLTSPDVIHSFWIPALGGKIDMIPGRETRLVLEPTRTGVFRGVCAEFCGASHALMAFPVVVMEKPDFDAWLARQRRPAATADDAAARRGRALFLNNGCGACHRVAGSAAEGTVGPDLSHLGGRLTLGAGTLPLSRDNLVRWIGHPADIKPQAQMPGYDAILTAAELDAIAAYLMRLR